MATTPSTLDEFPCQLDTKFRKDGTVVVYRERPKRWWGRGTTEVWSFVKDIGSGASGIVWLEEERETRQLRAVKRIDLRGPALREGNLGGLSSMERNIRRELQTLISLRNYGDLFVQFHGWYRGSEYIYFAMEYVEHGNLEKYLRQYPEQARMNVVEIAKQILKGLAVLHQRHICHRDLKPQNILVASLSPIHIKLADFGVSKCAKDTKLKTQVGTLSYQAPELLGLLPRAIQRGDEYTNAIDMWALGCIIYEISTTEMPFLQKQHDMISQISGIDYAGLDDDATTLRVDMGFLHAYCSGGVGITVEVLRSQVGDRGVDFVEKLLVPDPRSRISVADALNHRWMFDFPEIFDQKDGSEILRSQFLSLGIELSFESTGSLMLELRRRRDVDIKQFLPSSPRKNIGSLQRIAAAKGYALILDMLFKFQSQSAFDPDNGTNIDSMVETVRNRTALQAAAESGYLKVVKMLLERGANVNAEASPYGGRTALQAAAESGYLEVVEMLLARGANVNAEASPYAGRTALQAAAESGYLKVMEMLLARGANANAKPSYREDGEPLQAAARGGHHQAVVSLPESNANIIIGESSYEGRTAFQAAEIATGIHRAVEVSLPKSNAIIVEESSYEGRTALQAAEIARGIHRAVEILLLRSDANIIVEESSYGGRTALQAAEVGGIHRAVEALPPESDANINAKKSYGGRTALQAAAGGGYFEAVKLLLERGANINATAYPDRGRTALQAATEGGHLEVVKLLLRKGADINAEPCTIEGRTALQAAAEGGHLEVITLLLERGANTNAKPSYRQGRTALQAAARGGHLEAVRLLLDKGSEIDATPGLRGGQVALQEISSSGDLRKFRSLLKKNPNANVRLLESEGLTALQAAALGGHLEVVVLLLERGANISMPSIILFSRR